jgi:bidirectional [NiFe] hydrogenase diaphorase subunit
LPTADQPGDERFLALDTAMRRHQYQPDALIEVLHKAQELFGHLRPDVLRHVARGLKLPPSRAYGVATFYHLFTLSPQGEHACVVCTGTACFVRGAEKLLAAVEQLAHVKPGETTANRKLSLSTTRCIGTCGLAPVVIYDRVPTGDQGPEALIQHLREWL